MSSFYIIWSKSGSVLRGYDAGAEVDGSAIYPVAFPGTYSETEAITMATSAGAARTLESLTNLKLFLTGSDVNPVQTVWPELGSQFTPPRPDYNGGFEISFDQGRNYTRFDSTHGLASDPSTWITVPAISIGEGAVDGKLGPFDRATFYVRFRIPPAVDNFKLLDIQLAAGFDIV